MTPDRLAKAQDLLNRGRAADAATLLRAALKKDPTSVEARAMLGYALSCTGDFAQVEHLAKEGLRRAPGESRFMLLMVRSLRGQGRLDAAISEICAFDTQYPDDPLIAPELCDYLFDNGEYVEALARARKATKEGRMIGRFASIEASALHRLGRLDEAVASLRDHQRTNIADPGLAELLAVMLNYAEGVTPEESLAAHKRAARSVSEAAGGGIFKLSKPTDPEKRLRIAIASPDLRSHSVAFFAEPLIRHLDRSEFEVRCYHTGLTVDAFTRRIQQASDALVQLCGAVPLTIANTIYNDKADVLLDLAGLTVHGLNHVLALRPAPLQGTMIGYPATMGYSEVDFRIVDSNTDPAGADGHCVERLLRADPVFLCYTPPPEYPPVTQGPADANGFITFGTFNALTKINDGSLRFFASVLNAVPGSRFIFKVSHKLSEASTADLHARVFVSGIDPARTEFLAWRPERRDHLADLARCDIALDPFPYHGTTTTCEAMLMGIPTISRIGNRHVSRVSLTLNSAVGLADLCATTPDAALAAAVKLANDPSRLRTIRANLRATLLASPLCDGAAYGKRVGNLIREAWRHRCANPKA